MEWVAWQNWKFFKGRTKQQLCISAILSLTTIEPELEKCFHEVVQQKKSFRIFKLIHYLGLGLTKSYKESVD